MYLNELSDYFHQYKVLDLPSLHSLFSSRSIPSFHRDLKQLNCITSYSHRGRFYTCPDIPEYNKFGIWAYNEILFSKNGTSKETAKVLIEQSKTGFTYAELEDVVGIRMYNPLRDLVSDGVVVKEEVNGKAIYFSRDDANKRQQRLNRTIPEMPLEEKATHFENWVIIEVLLAVLAGKRNPHTIYRYMKERGIDVSINEIEDIYAHYNLSKKN